MSQNDPLLGDHWLDKESEQSLRPINGIAMNGKTLTTKTNLNHEPSDAMKAGLNPNGHRPLTGHRFKPGDSHQRQQLMSAIAMSSSDSSTDDIVIPMQKRRVKTRYPRKRRSRSTDSNLSIKSRALMSCPSICLKVVLTLLVISSIVFTIAFMAKLYDRIDSLQTAINDLSMSGNTVPQEMHSIHSHLKTLDTNVTAFGTRLVQAVDRIENLTLEVIQIKISLAKISESVEAAPAIRQLPKELQDLQKVVADLGSRMSTYDSEVKSIKQTVNSNQLNSDSLSGELASIHSNISELSSLVPNLSSLTAKAEHNGQQLAQMSETLTYLQQMTTNLINWRAQAEPMLNFTMNMTHHLHDKLHIQSQPSDTSETVGHKPEPAQPSATQSTASQSSPIVSHNKKQSNEELTASPVISETSNPLHE